MARANVAALSWRRAALEAGTTYTFEGSAFALAVLDGTVEVTSGNARERLVREVLVFDATTLVRAEALDDADLLAIELAAPIRL